MKLTSADLSFHAVPALAVSDDTFICDYHPVPDMTGTLTVK